MKNLNSKKQKGQSLLEVIIATGIISVALVAILGLVLQSLIVAGESKQRTQAAFLAQDVFERILVVRNLNLKRIAEGESTLSWDNNFYTSDGWYDYGLCCTGGPYTFSKVSDLKTVDDNNANIHTYDGVDFNRYINIIKNNGSEEERKITVTVEWQGTKGQTHSINMAMVVTKWKQ